MEPDAYCFLFGLMLVPMTFLFFPKLFFSKRLTLPFYVTSATIGLVGCSVYLTDAHRSIFYLYLLWPFISLLILKLGIFLFVKGLKRHPSDPKNHPYEKGVWWDRLFYIAFFSLNCALPILLLIILYKR